VARSSNVDRGRGIAFGLCRSPQQGHGLREFPTDDDFGLSTCAAGRVWFGCNGFGCTNGSRWKSQLLSVGSAENSVLGRSRALWHQEVPVSFNSAVQKSTIRKTSQAKDAKTMVDRFTKQTQGMLNQFKNNKKADQALLCVQDTANQIDKPPHPWATKPTTLGLR
jgi:hypothetical protein